MPIILNDKVYTGVKTDDVLADSPNPIKNSALNTFLNNNSSLSTTSKEVIGAINELKLGSVERLQTLPTPEASLANGLIYQYVGPTTASAPIYYHGSFYECVNDAGNYVWKEIDNSKGTITDVQVKGTSCVTGDVANITTLQNQIYYGEDAPLNPQEGDYWVYKGPGSAVNYAELDKAQTFTASQTFNEKTKFNKALQKTDSGNTYEYTLPNKTGTVALTSDITGGVDLTTDQVIDGNKTFKKGIKVISSAAYGGATAVYGNDAITVSSDGMMSQNLKLPTITNFEDTIALKSEVDGEVSAREAADTALQTDIDAKLPLAGGNLTGDLTINNLPVVTKNTARPTITVKDGWYGWGQNEIYPIGGGYYYVNITVRNDTGTAQGSADCHIGTIASGTAYDCTFATCCFEATSVVIGCVMQTNVLKFRTNGAIIPAGAYIPITGVMHWTAA